MRLDLASLEVLEAVIDTGSVAAAAERLHKARSAISYHLRRLEDLFSVSLLDRGGYRLSLTPEGEAMLAEARVVLRKSRELEEFAERIGHGWEPHLKIFFDGVLPINWVLRALGELEDIGAPTRIELRMGFLDSVCEAFIHLEGDLMISCALSAATNLQVQALPDVELILCCSARHPLAGLPEVDRDDLGSHTEIVIQGADETVGAIRPFFSTRKVFFLSDFNAKLVAIGQGLGFGWLPDHIAKPRLADGDLCEVRLTSGSRFTLSPKLATRSDHPRGKALQHIVERLSGSDWRETG